MWILRTLMLLALVVWVGGIIFFAFVVAPNLFHLITPEIAGGIVRRDLTWLHWMGIVCAVVFLTCSLLFSRAKFALPKPFALVNVLVLVMLVLTLISQFGVMPKMDVVRTEIHLVRDNDASLSRTPAAWPEIKQQMLPKLQGRFDHLHGWSTRLEGGVLFLGLAAVVLTARRFA